MKSRITIRKTGSLLIAALCMLVAIQPASAQRKGGGNHQQGGQHAGGGTRPAGQPHMRANRPQRPPAANRPPANRPSPQRPPVANRPLPQHSGVAHHTANRPGFRPQGWSTNRRAYTRPPVVFGGRRFYTYHRYYAHPYQPYYYGPTWHPVGFFLSAMIGAAIVVSVESRPYNYYDGVFYQPYNNGYQVVAAPPGAYVPSLPSGFQQVMVGSDTYYYYGGAFFVQNNGNYQVVTAPAGAVVYNIPDGATNEQVGDYSYVQYNGTYYQPIQVNGTNAYEVVELLPDGQ